MQLPDAADDVKVTDAHDEPLLTQVIAKDAATHSFELLAYVDAVPAMGYEVLHAAPGKSDSRSDLKVEDAAGSIVLTNSKLKATIDKKNGCITSLIAGGKEMLASGACGNQLQTYKDLPKEYDAWNIDPGTLDGTMTPIEQVDSVAVADKGPLRASVKVKRSWGSSKFEQEISLDAMADSLEVANEVDWHETHVLLKAAFPLAASGPKATYEIPYGSIERPTTRNNSWGEGAV